MRQLCAQSAQPVLELHTVKMKSIFLFAIVVSCLALFVSGFKHQLTIRPLYTFPRDADFTSEWHTDLSNDFDIRYHVIVHRDSSDIERLGLQFDLMPKNGIKYNNIINSTGYIAISSYDGKHRMQVDTRFDYSQYNKFISRWFDFPESFDLISSPYRPWKDITKDSVTVEHQMNYTIHGAKW